jgi:hypothetical protein
MRTLQISIFLFWMAILPAAYSQQKGIAEGRLINRTDPSIVARGVELEVIELGGGMSIIQSAVTDSSGKFRIEGLPLDRRLMVRAIYKGANYHGQLTFSAGKANVEIGVYEPTTSMKDIEIEGIQIAFRITGDNLESLETVTFNNKTKPPRTFAAPEGNFRFSKLTGIVEPPKMRVTAPGSMPLVQSSMESPDGTYYYSLYPLRPGITTFEVQQLLPYGNKSYSYVKKFFYDTSSVHIGVIPQDMVVAGQGITKVESNQEKNFTVYVSGPVKAGSEVAWQLSGGAEVPAQAAPETAGAQEVTEMPTLIGSNAPVIAPLLLMGFVLILWYAFNRSQNGTRGAGDSRLRQLREGREQLINSIADLDHRFETQALGKEEFAKRREESKRRLRRIFLLLKKQ